MTCPDCAVAEVNPRTGRTTEGCKQCSARELFNSIEYADARMRGRLTPAYMARLREVSGDDWESLHRIVKEWAKRA